MAEPYIIPSEPVESSNIAALGYDGVRRVLAITFKSGDIFHYADVEQDLALALYAAESIGTFYTRHIKGKFTGAKMTGRCPNCGNGPGVLGLTCDDCGTATYAETARRERRAS